MKDLLIDFDFFRHGVWKSILDEERCLQRIGRGSEKTTQRGGQERASGGTARCSTTYEPLRLVRS